MVPKVAVIGAGYWGANLIRVFNEEGVLKTICDTDKGRLKAQSKLYPKIRIAASLENVLSDKGISAVVIATPAVTHYEIAKRSLLAKKDVFVEKPLALEAKEGMELLQIARRTARILMVGHILNYHPAVIKLKKMIRDGRLGRIEYIYSNRLNIGKLRTEENILWSFAPHDISVILSLVGEEPVNVISSGGDYLSKGIYDITMTTLEFKDGVKGHIFVSWLHPFKEQKLIVVGRKAMAVFDDMTKDKLFIYPHRIEWKDGRIPVALKAEHYPVPVEEGEPLREEARHFMECVKKRKRPRTDAAEGVRVLNVLERAEMSLKKRQDVFIHPTSYIDEGVVIGKGTRIWHFSHIMKDTKIGKSCIIGQNVTAGPDVSIGDRCKIQNNVSIYKGVKLEDEVFCGPSSVFTNVYTPRAFIERKDEFLPTLVKKGATIGANATIVCGVVIGKYAFVAAGAVVKKDVADYGLVAGVPARQIGWACRCGVPLKGLETAKEARCGRCKASYRLKGGNLVIL